MTAQASRREFLALAGSGLFVFFRVEPSEAFQEPQRLPAPQYPGDFNAYLRIGGDGRVACFSGKVEYGQGVMTSLAQVLAEELDVAFESVDMIMGDTNLCPYDMGTFGSLTTRQFGPALRRAAAEARIVLLQMAAERLRTPVTQLRVKDGVVSDPAFEGRQVSYGQLTQGRRIERHVTTASLKAPAAFHIIGRTPPARKDARDKVTGHAKYAADIVLPGMLHARILRPPSHGAVLKGVDTSAVKTIEGARVVRDGERVAVLHERPDLAEKAFRLLQARFEPPQAAVDDQTIFEHVLQNAPAPQIVGKTGDLEEGERLASGVLEETYLNSYVAHAAIETHAAVASIEGGMATVWASTQTPFPLKNQVAQALGFAPENVRVITPYVGGGFGGKSASQQAVEAARLAQVVGRPVQVAFNRSEEFFYDTFRPAAVVKIRAGLTDSGRIVSWDCQVYGAGGREAQPFYAIPHQRTVSAGSWQGGNPPGLHPFAVGPWRAPSVNTNTFARESHIDMLAVKARVDPVEFRLNNLFDARMRSVLEAAAKHFGWQPAHAPSGRGIGVACGIYSGTYVVSIAQVAVNKTNGTVEVQRVVSAMDAGQIVNPDGARQQMEGSIMMGLGYTLSEEVRFRGGEILDRNFDSYQLPRFSWLPKIETVLLDNPDAQPSGVGEPPIITLGAVIANAIHDAAGIRLRQLPMTPVRVLAALRRPGHDA